MYRLRKYGDVERLGRHRRVRRPRPRRSRRCSVLAQKKWRTHSEFVLVADSIELWVSRVGRIHDRALWTRDDRQQDVWAVTRLQP